MILNGQKNTMKIIDLIEQLQRIQNQHADCAVEVEAKAMKDFGTDDVSVLMDIDRVEHENTGRHSAKITLL